MLESKINRMYNIIYYNFIFKILQRLSKPIFKLLMFNIKDNNHDEIDIIIFTKDRPLQLDALIKSCNFYIHGGKTINVMYNYSNLTFKKSILDVLEVNRVKMFIDENNYPNFQKCLNEILLKIKSNRIIFLVDDIIVKDYFSISDFNKIDLKLYLPSLRLGKNINYSFVNQQTIKIPKFKKHEKFLTFKWNKCNFEYAYPFSLDGHIFIKNEILFLIKFIKFNNPGEFEGKMQIFKYCFADRIGLCYSFSKLFNIPCNTVIDNNNNKYGELNTNLLLNIYENGERIDIDYYFKLNNNSVHENINLKIKN
jgi:hypothetical protein